MDNIFIKASRLKLRFADGNKTLTVEDLWSLSLAALDRIGISLRKAVEDSQTQSLIPSGSTSSPEKTANALAFDIVKFVIETKVAENEASKIAAEKRERKVRLLELIAEKQDQAFKDKPLEELLAEVNKL